MPHLKVQVHLWSEPARGKGRRYAIFQRNAEKGDYWQPITGNVEPGETPVDCALRETREEAGIVAASASLSPCLWVHDWSRGEKAFAEHVFALETGDQTLAISGEHRAVVWLAYKEALRKLHFEGNRRGLALAEAWLSEQP